MGNLYNIFLIIHSWNRWIILLSGFVLLLALIFSLSRSTKFNAASKALATTFLSSLHIQLLIGIILYVFLSPFTQAAFNDFGNAMKNSGLRYWAIEHTVLNVIGIVLAQIGYSISKRRVNDKAKQKTLLIWMGIAFLIILIAIPMGIMGVERPWFRF